MYKLVTDEKLLTYADLLLEGNHTIALDTETTGLFTKTDKMAGFSFSWKAGQAVYVPVFHQESNNCPLEVAIEFLERIKPLRIVMHNAVFDKSAIYSNTGKNLPVFADTMVYAALLNEPKGLKDLSAKFLNKVQGHFDELLKLEFGARWKSLGYNISHIKADNPELLRYTCEDADFTLQIFEMLKVRMGEHETILKIEENMIDIVVQLNLTGAYVDRAMLEDAIVDYEKSTEDLYKDICAVAGREISINSPVQLGNFLFNDLKLPVIERSKKTGAPSTSKEVLEELSDLHPVVGKIDKWRKDSRLLKAYLKKIPAGLDENDKIYSTFNSLGAVSGRFTSSSVTDSSDVCRGVNLQNIPKRKKKAIDMRAAFTAPEGWTFVKADYSQIEYRVMAWLSQDPYMTAAFKRGVDFHTFAAHMMFDIPTEEVTEEQRDQGKVFNFGLSYGMTAKGLATRLGCSEEEAEVKIGEYFKRLPKLVALIEATKKRAMDTGLTSTLFGRQRVLDIHNVPQQVKDSLLRKSFNTMIQGTAADILKIALIRLRHRLLKGNKNIVFQMTVHDECDFIIKDEYLEEYMHIIKECMELPVPESWAPIVVDISYGPNWSEDNQVKFKPTDFTPEKFTGWENVLPEGLTCSAEFL